MFSYKILDKTSIETLHKTFLDAFSDYQVKMEGVCLRNVHRCI